MTRYLTGAEFWYLAELVTGIEASTLMRTSRIDLVESALHAPAAGHGSLDFYPDLHDKSAILACRVAMNHSLYDGNKRVAWMCLAMFIDVNDGEWIPDLPDPEEVVEVLSRLVAHAVDEKWLAQWLRARVRFD